MRRGRVVAVLAAGVFAVAGCSGDGGDNSDGSTEAICQSLATEMDPLDDEFGPALTEVAMAGAQGDEAALEEATGRLDEITSRVTTSFDEAADRADDEQFAQALRDFGAGLENLVATVAEGEMLDTSELNTTVQELQGYCNVFDAPVG